MKRKNTDKPKKGIKIKNQLDEMQERNLLKIESMGFWIGYLGLFIALLAQVMIYGFGEWRYAIGEWIVFMIMCLYIVINCVRKGIWDRWLSPTPKANLGMSVLAGVIVGIVYFIVSYKRYGRVAGSIATGVFMFALVFAICFAALSATAYVYRRRVEREENAEETENIMVEEQENTAAAENDRTKAE